MSTRRSHPFRQEQGGVQNIGTANLDVRGSALGEDGLDLLRVGPARGVPGDELEIIAMPKGGGSSNVANHRMLKPGLGMKGVKQFVIEAVAAAGSQGCPPYFVGVGIGGSEDLCMLLAKKALLKPFKVRNPDPKLAAIEEELLEKINELGIGAMGLGEGPTALDVHIEMAARHPASLPVGIVIGCWALRHAKATIGPRGGVKIDKSA